MTFMQWEQLIQWPKYLLQLNSRHQAQFVHCIMVRLYNMFISFNNTSHNAKTTFTLM